MNPKKLKGVMLTNGDTAEDLAKALGLHRTTLSSKMHENGTTFTKAEIEIIRERYKLTAKQLMDIFFTPEVSNKDTTMV